METDLAAFPNNNRLKYFFFFPTKIFTISYNANVNAAKNKLSLSWLSTKKVL